MADTRQKNRNWAVATDDGKYWLQIEQATQLAVLMDIRDELQTLNQLLSCSNFTGIPETLRRIRANTAKPRKVKS